MNSEQCEAQVTLAEVREILCGALSGVTGCAVNPDASTESLARGLRNLFDCRVADAKANSATIAKLQRELADAERSLVKERERAHTAEGRVGRLHAFIGEVAGLHWSKFHTDAELVEAVKQRIAAPKAEAVAQECARLRNELRAALDRADAAEQKAAGLEREADKLRCSLENEHLNNLAESDRLSDARGVIGKQEQRITELSEGLLKQRELTDKAEKRVAELEQDAVQREFVLETRIREAAALREALEQLTGGRYGQDRYLIAAALKWLPLIEAARAVGGRE